MPYSAWLDLNGVPTITGQWSINSRPVWKVNPLLSPEYQKKAMDAVHDAWELTRAEQTPNQLGTMLACLEVLSVCLEMKMVIPGETQKALAQEQAFDYMPVF